MLKSELENELAAAIADNDTKRDELASARSLTTIIENLCKEWRDEFYKSDELNTRLKGQCQAYKKTIEVITKELRAEANVSGYREAAGKRWFRRA